MGIAGNGSAWKGVTFEFFFIFLAWLLALNLDSRLEGRNLVSIFFFS
jgi:hypothetical protein